MSYKSIQYYCPTQALQKLISSIDASYVIETHMHPHDDTTTYIYFLVESDNVQNITDVIQRINNKKSTNKAIVTTIDAVVPKPRKKQDEKSSKIKRKKFLGASREELLETISKGIVIDRNFYLLVIFSTIVAAIGLLENDVTILIGAMVIAPLLGPILALAFGSTLGDKAILAQALKANAAGFTVCLSISIIIGLVWPHAFEGQALIMRAQVNYATVILAIASGAAAVLSMTRGISSVMVGVMVAVALLPPATTLGIMLGAGNFNAAYGAFLLVATNIVCINLAAKTMLFWQGIRPRTWYMKKIAKTTSIFYLLFWVIALICLVAMITLKNDLLNKVCITSMTF